jgi:hypothetical protein
VVVCCKQARLVAAGPDGDRPCEDLLNTVLDTPLSKQLCVTLDAARAAGSATGAPAAVSSAIHALASLVHCNRDAHCAGSLASHFPLAASQVTLTPAGAAAAAAATGPAGGGDPKASSASLAEAELEVSLQESNRAVVAEAMSNTAATSGALRTALQKVRRPLFRRNRL